MSLKSIFKGWVGELQGTLAKKLFLDSETYIDLNNVTIPIENGTTQIDHVIVSKYGIFVVETKNMDGWIFGDEKSPKWTQSIFGKKFQFQNPLRQNYRHTKALSDFLGIDHDKFKSVVMFWGDCKFKTQLPANVLTEGYATFIKSHQVIHFSDAEVQEIAQAIKEGALPKTWATRKQHVANLKERFASTAICPRCSNDLVLRTVKSGENAGSRFYGCSKFPACRYSAKTDKPS